MRASSLEELALSGTWRTYGQVLLERKAEEGSMPVEPRIVIGRRSDIDRRQSGDIRGPLGPSDVATVVTDRWAGFTFTLTSCENGVEDYVDELTRITTI